MTCIGQVIASHTDALDKLVAGAFTQPQRKHAVMILVLLDQLDHLCRVADLMTAV